MHLPADKLDKQIQTVWTIKKEVFVHDMIVFAWHVWDEMTYPVRNFNGVPVWVWELMGNFIQHFIGHVTT